MSLPADDRAELALDVIEAYIVDDYLEDDAAEEYAAAGFAVEALVVDVAPGTSVLEPAFEDGEKPGRHLRVAPDSVRRRRHVRIAASVAAVSISATLFAVVGFNVELAQHQIQLQKLQRSLQAQQTRYYELRTEVAQRSSPPQIIAKAGGLGLVQAQTTYVPAPITPPPADPTGTSKVQPNAPGSSLEPVQ